MDSGERGRYAGITITVVYTNILNMKFMNENYGMKANCVYVYS